MTMVYQYDGDFFVLDSGEHDPVNITSSDLSDVLEPVISYDGTRIIYNYNGQIWGMNKDGSNRLRMSPESFLGTVDIPFVQLSHPRWGPAGDLFMATGDVRNRGDKSQIWRFNGIGPYDDNLSLIDSDGPGWVRDISWSRNGDKIAFINRSSVRRPGMSSITNYDLYSANSNGSDLLRLPNSSSQVISTSTALSPNGQSILWVSEIWSGYERGIYKTDSGGSGGINYLATGLNPSWLPDGSKIVYMFDSELWIMDFDGSNQMQITNNNYLPGNSQYLSFYWE